MRTRSKTFLRFISTGRNQHCEKKRSEEARDGVVRATSILLRGSHELACGHLEKYLQLRVPQATYVAARTPAFPALCCHILVFSRRPRTALLFQQEIRSLHSAFLDVRFEDLIQPSRDHRREPGGRCIPRDLSRSKTPPSKTIISYSLTP